MTTDEAERHCIYDELTVKRGMSSDKVMGKGPTPDGTFYIHFGATPVPNCGRQYLQEHETFTIGESDLARPSEPQY